jgi:hypothetical protein
MPYSGSPARPRRPYRARTTRRRAARILLTRPDHVTGGQAETLVRIEAACPQMTALTALIRSFAEMLTPAGKRGRAPAMDHQRPRG